MYIGGFEKFSLIDFPGKISGIIFLVGCNFRCPYCHNPELVIPELFPPPIAVEKVLSFFEKRKGKLDGIVVTGGEPTLDKDLFSLLKNLKELGFLVKLDTNGTSPEVLNTFLVEGLLDYVAMDIKAPLKKYREVARTNVDLNKIKKSISLIMRQNIEYEFRTTYFKPLLSQKDLINISFTVKGAKRYVIQKFRPGKVLDPAYVREDDHFEEDWDIIMEKIRENVETVIIR